MVEAKVTNPYILEYEIGHKIPQSITYYWGLVTEEKILEATRQAAQLLSVLPKPAETPQGV